MNEEKLSLNEIEDIEQLKEDQVRLQAIEDERVNGIKMFITDSFFDYIDRNKEDLTNGEEIRLELFMRFLLSRVE